MGMLKEFKDFVMRGNVVDLAVAVVIGAAFGAIVSSLVEHIITPLLLAPALKPVPLHEGIYGLVANVVVLILVSRMTKPVSAERLKYYSEAGWD